MECIRIAGRCRRDGAACHEEDDGRGDRRGSGAPHGDGRRASTGDLEPLAFLVGTWRGEGAGEYPTIESFRYGVEWVFEHTGKPFLAYGHRTRAAAEAGAPPAAKRLRQPSLPGSQSRPVHASTAHKRP